MSSEYQEIEFEFFSTPFNEDIPPHKVSKIEKMVTCPAHKDHPIQQLHPQHFIPPTWSDMNPYFPYFPPKNIMQFPPQMPSAAMMYSRDKTNPIDFLRGLPRDKMESHFLSYPKPLPHYMTKQNGYMDLSQ